MHKSRILANTVKSSYLYMIQEREFIRLNEPTYKIGKTKQSPNTRLAGYPKNSRVIIFAQVLNCDTAEKRLILAFDNLYTQRKEYGREYYSGDESQMKSTFCKVVLD